MFSICLRAFLPCRGGCSAFCYSPTRPPELLSAFFEVALGQGHANNDAFQKKSLHVVWLSFVPRSVMGCFK